MLPALDRRLEVFVKPRAMLPARRRSWRATEADQQIDLRPRSVRLLRLTPGSNFHVARHLIADQCPMEQIVVVRHVEVVVVMRELHVAIQGSCDSHDFVPIRWRVAQMLDSLLLLTFLAA